MQNRRKEAASPSQMYNLALLKSGSVSALLTGTSIGKKFLLYMKWNKFLGHGWFLLFLLEKISGRKLKCQINLPKYVDLNIVQPFKSSYFQNAHWHLKNSLNLLYLFHLLLSCIWLPLWRFRVPFILIVVDGNDANILIRLFFYFIIIAVFVLAVFFFIRCTFGPPSVCLRRCV